MIRGKGMVMFEDGSYCEGNFLNNQLSGKGECLVIQSHHYKGKFKNSMYDGKGLLKTEEGMYF